MDKEYYWLSLCDVLARKIDVQSITVSGPVLFILYSADAVRYFSIQWFVQFSPALCLVRFAERSPLSGNITLPLHLRG